MACFSKTLFMRLLCLAFVQLLETMSVKTFLCKRRDYPLSPLHPRPPILLWIIASNAHSKNKQAKQNHPPPTPKKNPNNQITRRWQIGMDHFKDLELFWERQANKWKGKNVTGCSRSVWEGGGEAELGRSIPCWGRKPWQRSPFQQQLTFCFAWVTAER